DGNRIINRADIVMEGGADLSRHQPVDIRVGLKNVMYPGTYSGTFHFMLIGQPERLPLPVEAHIGVVPKVVPVTDTLRFRWFAAPELAAGSPRSCCRKIRSTT